MIFIGSFKRHKRVDGIFIQLNTIYQLIYILDNYWRSTENQRKFFIEFAAKKGFDPLVPENWDKITTRASRKLVRKKGMICGMK